MSHIALLRALTLFDVNDNKLNYVFIIGTLALRFLSPPLSLQTALTVRFNDTGATSVLQMGKCPAKFKSSCFLMQVGLCYYAGGHCESILTVYREVFYLQLTQSEKYQVRCYFCVIL